MPKYYLFDILLCTFLAIYGTLNKIHYISVYERRLFSLLLSIEYVYVLKFACLQSALGQSWKTFVGFNTGKNTSS